ncbi:MAG: Uma2 family endonuclease [Bacteroidota bacterium]
MELASLDINKVYTYADYLKWDFKERVELIKGRLFKMSPAPSSRHQQVSMRISNAICNYLDGKPCEVYAAPFDVRLPRKSKDDRDIVTVVQPDICVICDISKIDSKGCLGAPDIVIEILSPGNSKTELNNKFEIYEEAGVKEYWIVFPHDNTFIVYTMTDGKYISSRPMTEGTIVTSSVLPGLIIDVAKLFSKIR